MLSLLSSCAISPDHIPSTNVPIDNYIEMNCDQLMREVDRTTYQLVRIAKNQEATSSRDASLVGASFVSFLPIFILLPSGEDKVSEISILRGKHEAIEHAMIEKKCELPDDIIHARERRMENYEIKNGFSSGSSLVTYPNKPDKN